MKNGTASLLLLRLIGVALISALIAGCAGDGSGSVGYSVYAGFGYPYGGWGYYPPPYYYNPPGNRPVKPTPPDSGDRIPSRPGRPGNPQTPSKPGIPGTPVKPGIPSRPSTPVIKPPANIGRPATRPAARPRPAPRMRMPRGGGRRR